MASLFLDWFTLAVFTDFWMDLHCFTVFWWIYIVFTLFLVGLHWFPWCFFLENLHGEKHPATGCHAPGRMVRQGAGKSIQNSA